MKLVKDEMHGQCAWCKKVENGPYEGAVVFEQEREPVPVLFKEYSHGICSVCETRLLGSRRFRKVYSSPPVLDDGAIVPFRR